jgi:hypothetical protein
MVKSIKLSSVLFAVLATIFVGCKKDDDNPTALNPTISFVNEGAGYYTADAEVDSGAIVKVKIIAQKGPEGAKLKHFKLVKKVTGANETVVDSTLSSASDATFNYTFSGSIVTSPTTLEFTITDKDGKSATKSIKFTIKAGPTITKPNVKTLNFTSTLVFFNGSNVIDSATASTNPSTAYFRYYNSQATGTTLISAAQLATAGYQSTPIYTPWATATAEFRNLTITDNQFQEAKNQDKSQLTTWFNAGTKTVADPNNPAGTRANNLTTGQFLGINAGGVIWIAKVTATSQTSLALEVLY